MGIIERLNEIANALPEHDLAEVIGFAESSDSLQGHPASSSAAKPGRRLTSLSAKRHSITRFFALDVAEVAESGPQCLDPGPVSGSRLGTQKADAPDFGRCLCQRTEWRGEQARTGREKGSRGVAAVRASLPLACREEWLPPTVFRTQSGFVSRRLGTCASICRAS